MSDVRQLWFESHLLSGPDGQEAHRRCAALGEEQHAAILAFGDRLARSSAAAAQQFYRVAAEGVECLGPAFDDWVTLGITFAERDPGIREAAIAYFSVSPAAAVGRGDLRHWGALIRRLSQTSRKLATLFCETTAPLLAHTTPAALDAWVEEGLRLHGAHGWQGEFLAQAFFAAAPRALPVLSPTQFSLWADLGAAVRRAVKSETDVFNALPGVLRHWSEEDRTAVLEIALDLAATAPKAAVAFYAHGPEALRHLPPAQRTALLRACAPAARHGPAGFAEVIPVLGAVIQAVPEEHRQLAIDLTGCVGERCPQGVPPLLRSLPRAFEETHADGVRAWAERGLALATTHALAAQAFFALESRTSLSVLRAASTAAALEDVQGLLRKFVQMLSAQPAVIRTVTAVRLLPPLEPHPAENEIALPLRVDSFATYEDNERLYRLLGALIAGRREYATYAAVPRPADAEGPPGSELVAHLRDEARPTCLEDLFLLADGYRVARRMTADYPGLAGEVRWAAAALLAQWADSVQPGEETVFDCLLALALSAAGSRPPAPAWLLALGRIVLPCLAPLAGASVTAADALAVAEHLAALLVRSDAPRRAAPDQFEFGGLLLERFTGDELLGIGADAGADADGDAPHLPVAAGADGEADGVPEVELRLDQDSDAGDGGSRPMTLEELVRLLESGADLRISQGQAQDIDGVGLYITDLIGKLPPEQLEELRRLLGADESAARRAARWPDTRRDDTPMFLYDEWDYHIGDYRPRWCTLLEIGLDGDSGVFFHQTLTAYASIMPEIRRQFQRIRPEMYRVVRGLEDGEDFDLNAAVSARVDVRARRSPSPKLYVARHREERDVATLFLLDMSASTDEPVAHAAAAPSGSDGGAAVRPVPGDSPQAVAHARPRRIIDITKEALVLMAEALEEIGDAYAIYGFSGHGRKQVEFYSAKSFTEQLTSTVKGRIGGIEPKRSTRMGTALRHAIEKMSAVNSASKYLILLSDGFPQDFDYGQDRRSNVYGIRDTTMALREVEAAGITAFCITVDKAGHDYLREMCDTARYLVIEDIASLPRELPKIYQRVVAPA